MTLVRLKKRNQRFNATVPKSEQINAQSSASRWTEHDGQRNRGIAPDPEDIFHRGTTPQKRIETTSNAEKVFANSHAV
jgi:hypothetical protein